MKKLSERQWGDVGYKILNRPCVVCGSSTYSEPNYGEIDNVDVLTVSCSKCGRVAIYDVTELAAIADAFNKSCIDKGQRKPED